RYFGQSNNIVINPSLIKTESRNFDNATVSVRAIAKFRSMKSSFSIVQYLDKIGIDKLKPTIDKQIDDVFGRMKDKQSAVNELRLRLVQEQDTLLSDTKLNMALLSNLPVNHPWVSSRLQSLWIKELHNLCLGAGLKFYSGLAGFNKTIDINNVKFHN